MLSALRRHFVAWLIHNHPQTFLRWKRAAKHRVSDDREFLRLHARAVKELSSLQRFEERYTLWSLCRSLAARPGSIAEVGVYRGGSALLLAAAKQGADLYLFDTFAGMPAVNPTTDGHFQEGDFSNSSLSEVKSLLHGYPRVHFHPGIFPHSAATLATSKLTFKLVHLDVDLHSSTTAALEWFYPRMERGGLIVSHDYNDKTVPGVKQAFDEFFADKMETVVPIWFSQAVVTKL